VIDVLEIPVDRLVAIIAMQNAIARTAAGLDSVMAVVVERATALTGATGAVVELIDGDSMLYRAAYGSASGFVGLRLSRQGSLSGLCITEAVALYAADTSTDDRVDRAACQRVGVASMVCVPLFHDGAPVGVLKVLSNRAHQFDDSTAATIALLADVVAASMHHAQQYEAAVTMSLQDGLTGLLNRRAFDRQLVQEIARSTRHRHPLSVAMFDLDGLKAANDTFGHAAGDAILRDAASLLCGTLRVHDGCFRIGGDEFAAILPETTEDNARHAVRRCVTSVVDARLGDGRVGVSAGVAEIQPGESPIALVERADAALYENKRKNHASRSGPIKTIKTIKRAGSGKIRRPR
jgi:diguanylate cyclase (GGDEF)-like protein